MRIQRRSGRKARIEIIPMIDTIFFLLVFFMMATLSMSHYSGLPVNLPKAATGQQPPSESAAVTMIGCGKVTVLPPSSRRVRRHSGREDEPSQPGEGDRRRIDTTPGQHRRVLQDGDAPGGPQPPQPVQQIQAQPGQ